MFPGFFEWIWDGGHMLFMGALWYALSIIGMGMTWCVIKAAIDTAQCEGGHHGDHHGGHH
ncbi:MAG: hypothetical protein AB7S75_23990 [Desulfococcaceae bacterium]